MTLTRVIFKFSTVSIYYPGTSIHIYVEYYLHDNNGSQHYIYNTTYRTNEGDRLGENEYNLMLGSYTHTIRITLYNFAYYYDDMKPKKKKKT